MKNNKLWIFVLLLFLSGSSNIAKSESKEEKLPIMSFWTTPYVEHDKYRTEFDRTPKMPFDPEGAVYIVRHTESDGRIYYFVDFSPRSGFLPKGTISQVYEKRGGFPPLYAIDICTDPTVAEHYQKIYFGYVKGMLRSRPKGNPCEHHQYSDDSVKLLRLLEPRK